MYGENTKTIAIPIYRVLPYPVIIILLSYEWEGRDGYKDQIVTFDVGVYLHSKIHPLFMKYCNGTSTQCYAYNYTSIRACSLCFFYNPI